MECSLQSEHTYRIDIKGIWIVGLDNPLEDATQIAKTANEILPQTTAEADNMLSTMIGWFNNVILYPVKKANITYKYKLESFKSDLEKKISCISENNLREPNLMIAGPVLEALKYAYDEAELRNMYVNLLASSMNMDKTVHPGFVDVIRQLTPDEAKMLVRMPDSSTLYRPIIDLQINLSDNQGQSTICRNYTNEFDPICECPENICLYFENLDKLKLIHIPDDMHIVDDKWYAPLENCKYISSLKAKIVLKEGEDFLFKKKLYYVTDYGTRFIDCCVK